MKPALPLCHTVMGPFPYKAVPWLQIATQPSRSLSVVTTVKGVAVRRRTRFWGPPGPCTEASHIMELPSMTGGSSALNSPQCLRQQVFGEGGANKGYGQQGL